MNKRGALTDIFVWIIIGFVFLAFIGVWMYGWDRVTTSLTDLGATVDTSTLNITSTTNDTFGNVNQGLQVWKWASFLIIFTLGLSILISSFLVKANPVFFIVYILIVVVAVIFSAYVSNAYEILLTDSVVGGTFQGFVGSSFIFANLHIWTTIIGIMGAIFLFMGILRDARSGGSVV